MSYRLDILGTLQRAHRTDEGFLFADARFTRAGVFTYRNADGTDRRELRHPDDVSDPASLATLGRKPVTLEHPVEPVTPDNADALVVGTLGETIDFEGAGGFVRGSLAVLRGDALKAIDGGKLALSCGYHCDLDDEQGTYNGERYDARQRNIRYNHVALVDRGRAGRDVHLRADGAYQLPSAPAKKRATVAQVKIGRVTYDVESETLAGAIAEQGNRADSAEARADAASAKADAAQAKLDAIKPFDHVKWYAGRKRLDALAAGVGVDDVDKLDDGDLKRAIVAKHNDKIDLDGKSAGYVDAYVDFVADALEAEGKRLDDLDGKLGGNPPAGSGSFADRMKAAKTNMFKHVDGEG